MIALSFSVPPYSPIPMYTDPHSNASSPDFLADQDLDMHPDPQVSLAASTADLDETLSLLPASAVYLEDPFTPVLFSPSAHMQEEDIVSPAPLHSLSPTEVSLLPELFASLHARIETLNSTFLQHMLDGQENSWENHWRVSCTFARLQHEHQKIAAKFSSSENTGIKAAVALFEKTIDALRRKIEAVKRVTCRSLVISTPFQANLLEISYWSERCPVIDIDFPPPLKMFTERAVFQVFALDHEQSFIFNGHMYPSVLAAFKANGPLHHSEEDLTVLMYKILKAKFNSSPEIKRYLCATLRAYLVIKMPEAYEHLWGPDTSNRLGLLFMKLRKKFGGLGKVPKPAEESII